MNELAAARSMWERAKALNPTDPTVRNMIDARLSPTAAPVNTGKYTVQLGAFSSRLNAQAQLDRHLARASGVGVPLRIVQVASRGRTLFAVRAGRFVSKPEADRIARELGPQAATVLVTGE
jgi:cell division septation protein DedD